MAQSTFQSEVDQLVEKTIVIDGQKELVLFVGSSSIRFWESLQEDLPELQAVNRGFGGSQMSDLLYHADELIFTLESSAVVIYEGDNDLAAGEAPEDIIKEASELLSRIKSVSNIKKIYFISAKPSIARWTLADQYKKFNELLEVMCMKYEDTHYIDVWTPLCTPAGEVMEDVFIFDGLHLNKKGYRIWAESVRGAMLGK